MSEQRPITVAEAAEEYHHGNRCARYCAQPVYELRRRGEAFVYEVAYGPVGQRPTWIELEGYILLELAPGAERQAERPRSELLRPEAFRLAEALSIAPAPLRLALSGALADCAALANELGLSLLQKRSARPPYPPIAGTWLLQDPTCEQRGLLAKDDAHSTPDRPVGVLLLRRSAWLAARLAEPESELEALARQALRRSELVEVRAAELRQA